MKKRLIGLSIILLVGLSIAVGIGFTGCATCDGPGARYVWQCLTPGHYETFIFRPRCPGCPPQTNVVWCPALYGWKPVAP